MTCQPAVKVGLLFPMAINTESHQEAVFFESVHGLHLPVTLIAKQFLFNVSLMVEEDKLRNIVYLNPRRWSLGVVVFVFLLNPRKILDNVIMAVKAFLHRRNPRELRALHIGVAKLALNVLVPGMYPVTERYGLFRSYVRRINIEEIEEKNGSKGRKEGEEQGPPVPIQCLQETVL
jgi:hypothetical protein